MAHLNMRLIFSDLNEINTKKTHDFNQNNISVQVDKRSKNSKFENIIHVNE